MTEENTLDSETKSQPSRKKKHVGRKVFLIILLLLVATGLGVYGSMSWLKPKNLGVKYTQKDYNDVIQKIGMHVSADLGNGEVFDNKEILAGSDDATGYASADAAKKLKMKDLSFTNYDWKFTNYQEKSIRVSNVEASAFFNEIAPAFWWFKNTQVKISDDGTIITSSSANIEKMKNDLFGDVADMIPVSLPSKLNLYTEGDFSITDNKISMTPTVMKSGTLSLPENMKSGSNLSAFSGYLERFYTVIPDLRIDKAARDGKEFIFEGNIPTEVVITPKK
jgi:hypothetical protein